MMHGRKWTMLPQTRDELRQEIKRCKEDPWYTMTTYFHSLDPQKGKLKFPDYPYLKDLCHLIHTEQFVIILKSRQMFITWLVVAYCLWENICNFGKLQIFISYRQSEVQEMVKRAKFIYDNNPTFLRPELGTENKKELEFKRRNSRIIALPSVQQGSTRTYSASRIVMDEAAYISNADEFYRGARPSLTESGKMIILSSSNGIGNLFSRLFSNVQSEMVKV